MILETIPATLLEAIPENTINWNKIRSPNPTRWLSASHTENGFSQFLIMVDLMVPFRSKHIYHWKFKGSYSIKYVLPALIPELKYDTLNISDGGTAAESWLRMRASTDREEQEQIKRDLLEYCHLDTLAMVKILDKMHEIAKNSSTADFFSIY